MKLDRREVLLGTGALATLGSIPRLMAAAVQATTADAAAEALLAEAAEEL